MKKDFEAIEGTTRNSRQGHNKIGAYQWKGLEITIGDMYGLSVNSDRLLAEIF